MTTALHEKTSVGEIRARFDNEVDRFSTLETGQQSTLDAPVVLDLLHRLAPHWLREGSSVLDLGCGAGNYALKLLDAVNPLDCTLLDLSEPMLARALTRVGRVNRGRTATIQGDMREVALADDRFDLIVTGAALHHLRASDDWERMFARIARWLRPGGILFVSDLVACDDPAIQGILWERYGRYLEALGGAQYRDKVFAYVDREDSPRSLPFQHALLERHGFERPETLHRNAVFATYFARKASPSER